MDWCGPPLPHIARRMAEQRQAMARMVSWLDQCPSPPRKRPSASAYAGTFSSASQSVV